MNISLFLSKSFSPAIEQLWPSTPAVSALGVSFAFGSIPGKTSTLDGPSILSIASGKLDDDVYIDQ